MSNLATYWKLLLMRFFNVSWNMKWNVTFLLMFLRGSSHIKLMLFKYLALFHLGTKLILVNARRTMQITQLSMYSLVFRTKRKTSFQVNRSIFVPVMLWLLLAVKQGVVRNQLLSRCHDAPHGCSALALRGSAEDECSSEAACFTTRNTWAGKRPGQRAICSWSVEDSSGGCRPDKEMSSGRNGDVGWL